jgi:micrococcal nuclease
MERATVVDIIDGDTLDVILDGREERVRIFGIDTPERGDRCFSEAADLLAALAGAEIRMKTDIRTVDRNGRLLRYVYQPGGLSIDAAMIAAGAAHAWTRDGALRDQLVDVEANARARSAGCLWS